MGILANISEPVLQFMLVAAILGLSIYLKLYTGMFSLANAGFMSIGAYTGVVLTQYAGAPLGVAIIGGMLAAGVIALPIGLPVLRLRDLYLAIATIGFGEVVRIIFLNFDDLVSSIVEFNNRLLGVVTMPVGLIGREINFIVTHPADVTFEMLYGARGIRSIPKLTETWHLVLFLVLVSYFMLRLHRSRFGRAMAAIRQDESAAANMGVNVVYVKTVVFIMSAMLAGAAGAFNGHLTRIITPGAYNFDLAVSILAYAVLGGTATFVGPIVGGMVLRGLPELAREFAQYADLFNGVVLLLVIIFLPGGIINPRGWRRLWQRLTAGKAPDEKQQNAQESG